MAAPPRTDFDAERLSAERPSWRLFRAHPALGLEETDDDHVLSPGAQELGLRWLVLQPDEQRAREADFRRALLQIAARADGARFEAAPSRGETAQGLAARVGGEVTEDGAVVGWLTPGTVETLARERPDLLIVEGSPELVVITSAIGAALGVWTDRWHAPALEREVTDAWWAAAQRRRMEAEAVPLPERRRRDTERAVQARVVLAVDRGACVALGARRGVRGLVAAAGLGVARRDRTGRRRSGAAHPAPQPPRPLVPARLEAAGGRALEPALATRPVMDRR